MPRYLSPSDAGHPEPPRRRFLFAAGYLLMATAGVLAGVWPSPNVTNAAASHYLVLVWDLFLLVGGLCAAIGAVTERWLGEYVGLPLLAAVFGVYGVAAFAVPRSGAAAGGAAFCGIALLFIGRWTDLSAVRRLLRAAGRRPDPRGPASTVLPNDQPMDGA